MIDALGGAVPGGIESGRFREALGHFATGVTVVTGRDGDEPLGLTCQSFVSLSLEPPMVGIAPAKSSTSWPRIERSGRFCVNVLGAEQEALARSFAVSGGWKFGGVGWEPGRYGAPVLAGVLAWIECDLLEVHDAGDHVMVYGHAVELGVGSGTPLLYYRGGFGRFEP